jgi:hypothetical protein
MWLILLQIVNTPGSGIVNVTAPEWEKYGIVGTFLILTLAFLAYVLNYTKKQNENHAEAMRLINEKHECTIEKLYDANIAALKDVHDKTTNISESNAKALKELSDNSTEALRNNTNALTEIKTMLTTWRH